MRESDGNVSHCRGQRPALPLSDRAARPQHLCQKTVTLAPALGRPSLQPGRRGQASVRVASKQHNLVHGCEKTRWLFGDETKYGITSMSLAPSKGPLAGGYASQKPAELGKLTRKTCSFPNKGRKWPKNGGNDHFQTTPECAEEEWEKKATGRWLSSLSGIRLPPTAR